MGISADATLTKKGQVTIPKEIRDRLGLEAGQEIEFVLDESGDVTVRPKEPPMDRLRNVRERIERRHESIDVDAIRRESKRAWGSVDASVEDGR